MGPRLATRSAAAYWSRHRALTVPPAPIAPKEATMINQPPPVIELPSNGYVVPSSPVLPGRKLSSFVKKVEVVLDGDYDGLRVLFWANPPLSLFEDLAAKAAADGISRLHDQLLPVIADWNLLTEDGQPLKVSSEAISALPLPLAKELTERFSSLINIPEACAGLVRPCSMGGTLPHDPVGV
jgi:hypothetical protein